MAVPPAGLRAAIREVRRRSFDQSDQFHRDARALRNRLVVTSLVAASATGLLVILQWRLPNAALFRVPVTKAGLPRWALMMLVMVFGSVGGLVTAIPAMAAIPTVNSPFNFPLPQGLLKIVVGSLTAVVGVVVIGSSGATTGLASLQSLLGVAVIFGAGQQAITQFLDKRAGTIIAKAVGQS